jgi:hypothetical protein
MSAYLSVLSRIWRIIGLSHAAVLTVCTPLSHRENTMDDAQYSPLSLRERVGERESIRK